MSGVPWGDWVALKPCGTSAAYRRHLRHGEQPCESCRRANVRAVQDSQVRNDRNARRRQIYAAARAMGLNARQANAAAGRGRLA